MDPWGCICDVVTTTVVTWYVAIMSNIPLFSVAMALYEVFLASYSNLWNMLADAALWDAAAMQKGSLEILESWVPLWSLDLYLSECPYSIAMATELGAASLGEGLRYLIIRYNTESLCLNKTPCLIKTESYISSKVRSVCSSDRLKKKKKKRRRGNVGEN